MPQEKFQIRHSAVAILGAIITGIFGYAAAGRPQKVEVSLATGTEALTIGKAGAKIEELSSLLAKTTSENERLRRQLADNGAASGQGGRQAASLQAEVATLRQQLSKCTPPPTPTAELPSANTSNGFLVVLTGVRSNGSRLEVDFSVASTAPETRMYLNGKVYLAGREYKINRIALGGSRDITIPSGVKLNGSFSVEAPISVESVDLIRIDLGRTGRVDFRDVAIGE